MDSKEILTNIKKSWKWVWNSDSILSWIVALAIIFIVVKFIFFPTLSLIMGTSLPLAGVESSSMDHQIVKDDASRLNLCGKIYSKETKEHINFDEYWEACGNWYENNKDMTKETFSNFWMKNGFRKGDIIIVWGRFTPKLGDIIIFQPGTGSSAPRPIIHRIVDINEQGIIETKGDHNERQLTGSNNIYRTDETNIHPDQIIGKAIIKIPYLGWVKIWFTDLINIFRR
jgi:signal peptidase I